MAIYAAMRVMKLILARDGSEQDATIIFSERECELLEQLQPTLEGRTEKQKNKFPKGKLSWAAWIIGRLGGWKGYAKESPPGPITMYYGMEMFQKMYDGWNLAKMCG